MAAVEQKNDVSLNSGITPTTSREELVLTAVKFLQNPKVNASPYAQRKSFLLRKGLTEAEVEEAVRRSGGTTEDHVVSPGVTPGTSTVAVNMPMAVATPASSVSIWIKLRDFFNAGLFISGTIYALYLFYKKFIVRWWFGTSSQDGIAENSSTVAINDLRSNVAGVTSAVAELKELVSRTNEQLDSLTRSHALNKGAGEPSGINTTEIKDEIRSLKSLLLSKNQFPPVPSGAPVLPSWQRQTSSARPVTTSMTVSSKDDGPVSVGAVAQATKVEGVTEQPLNELLNISAVTSAEGVMSHTFGPKDNAALPVASTAVLPVDETKALYEGLNGLINDEVNGETFNNDSYESVDDVVNMACDKSSTSDASSLFVGLGDVALVERPDPCHETNGLSEDHDMNGAFGGGDESNELEEGNILSVEHIGESIIGGRKTRVIVNDEESM